MKKIALGGLSLLAAALMMGSYVNSAEALHSPSHYSLFDDAAYITPGNASDRAVELTSDSDPGFGGIEYGLEDDLTFAEVGQLSTDYRFPDGESCGGGSPRFQIRLDTGTTSKNVFVYLGPSPSYAGCADEVWNNSGDLLQSGMTVDTSQLSGGTFYDPYDDAVTKYGAYEVEKITLVADAGWAFGDDTQVVDVDNTNVDGTLFTYEEPGDDTAPNVPTHIAPANNSALTSAEFTEADWTTVTDGTSTVTYIFQSSNSSATTSDGSFVSPVFTSGELSDSEISTVGTPEGVWYWHVRSVDEDGNMSAWTDAWKVTVDNTPDPDPDPDPTQPDTKDECKNGGWKTFTNPTFKNQGQCVSSVAKAQDDEDND